jgi:hypothetical protein
MKLAEKVEFGFRPDMVVGHTESGREITRIEVYEMEYHDHSELHIVAISGNATIVSTWCVPAVITYQEADHGDA